MTYLEAKKTYSLLKARPYQIQSSSDVDHLLTILTNGEDYGFGFRFIEGGGPSTGYHLDDGSPIVITSLGPNFVTTNGNGACRKITKSTVSQIDHTSCDETTPMKFVIELDCQNLGKYCLVK